MKRYPGIRPFNTDESDRFFGRDQDIERLWRLIRLEQVVILYGKSGYGKSSLLSAGIYPKLAPAAEADTPIGKRYQHWEIRFGPYQGADSRPPLETLRSQIIRSGEPSSLFPADQFGATLWQALKSRQTAAGKRFILFFDQFEEIFTYPPEQVAAFKKQLAEALYTAVPDAVADAHLRPEQEDALNDPFELKVVFAIRADRMSQLNALQDYLPNLLRHSYPLDALDEQQATAAITAPALLVDGGASSQTPGADAHFDTPPFRYAPATLALIFNELRDTTTGKIETSALQIVCRHVEDNIVGPETAGDLTALSNLNPSRTIGTADLGDIKSIFREFYDRTVAALPAAQQPGARRLVEDILIKDGIRLPFAEQALLAEPGVTADLLQTLTAASMLRVERDEQGRMLYEVGHDTLVGPISEAAQVRRAEEEKIRLEQYADQQRKEKEKAVAERRRARFIAAAAIVLALFALAALIFALQKNTQAKKSEALALKNLATAELEKAKAQEQTVFADTQKNKADSLSQIALLKTKVAEDANIQAQKNLDRARFEEARTKNTLIELEEEKNATAAALSMATENYDLSQQKTKEAQIKADEARLALLEVEKTAVSVVRNLLRDASSANYRLDYDAARDRLHDAARFATGKPFESPLGLLRPAIADSLLEPAYFYAESGNYAAALLEIDLIIQMLDRPDPTNALQDKVNSASSIEEKQQARAAFRAVFQDLCPIAFRMLEAKYFPTMIQVTGGTFQVTEKYQSTLSNYSMASTETTVWQYNLYLAAQGKDIFDNKIIDRPGWGWEGDNPIVNVQWYDAVQYANWVSQQRELAPSYAIDIETVGGDFLVDWLPGKNGFHLPTEAEWEYAAKGGITGLSDKFEYAGSNELNLVGWYYSNSSNRTHPVAQMLPNQLGLYDMSGNVWEWCWDWYDTYPLGPVDNWRGQDKGGSRVFRGGSWFGNAVLCRAACRDDYRPTNRNNNIGFRLARSL